MYPQCGGQSYNKGAFISAMDGFTPNCKTSSDVIEWRMVTIGRRGSTMKVMKPFKFLKIREMTRAMT
jgi:hypothetical protein